MQSPRLPRLTHLQFLVLGLLRDSEQAGRLLRTTLATHGVRSTAPAFYQLMARLERDGLVEGRYEQVRAGDQAVTERRYRLLPAGATVWTEARDFYAAIAAGVPRERLSDA
ncbi:MAG: helix-turn-helix transcriptional regulator [Acidobacteriota bacterium]|nr:helix-turn-helix transcriptional regulator [Acidobacteriota bacterium]